MDCAKANQHYSKGLQCRHWRLFLAGAHHDRNTQYAVFFNWLTKFYSFASWYISQLADKYYSS